MDRDPSSFLKGSSQFRADNPEPPEPPDVKVSTATPTTSAGTGALPPAAAVTDSEPAAAPLAAGSSSSPYTVAERDDGSHDVFAMGDDGPQKIGTAGWGKDDLRKILGTAGAIYDPKRGVYENVPEYAAKMLVEQEPVDAGTLKARLNIGLADFHRGALGVALARGEITAEDFRQRTRPDLVQMQFDRNPGAAWKGLGDAISDFMQKRHAGDPTGALKGLGADAWADAKLLPEMTLADAQKSLPSLADLASYTTGGMVVGGMVGALGGPEMVPVGMKLGAAAGSFVSLYNQELGSRMAALADRGLGDVDIRKHAPAEAVKSAVGAAVFMYGLDAMAAPFKAPFLAGLAGSEAATKTIASWAYHYGLNAGVKMPAVGVVHQATSDLLDNMSAWAENHPEQMISPTDFANRSISAGAGMGRLGAIMGIPGAVWEGGNQYLDRARDARLAREAEARLEGVERREPIPASQESPAASSAQGPSPLPSGEQSAGPSARTAGSGPLSETPQAPLESSSPASADLRSPLPDSIKEHPGYVKAVEAAKDDLPPGVDPSDRQGVVDAFNKTAKESHDYINSVTKALGLSEMGKGNLTPDEKNMIEAKIMEYAAKMRSLGDLAVWSRDPEGAAAHADWEANGREGPEPRLPVEPFNESRGYYKQGGPLADTETARFIESEDAARAAAASSAKLDETLGNKDAKPADVVDAASKAAEAKDRLGEKVQEKTVEGRRAQVQSDLDALRQRIGEIASTRDRMKQNGLSTRALDRQVIDLTDRAVAAQKELDRLQREPSELEVSPKAKLQVKPATLGDITDIAFKEGGKQSQARARELLKIAEDNGLTAADVKKLVGNKSIGAMGDVAYKNFLDGFEREAENGEKTRTPGFREQVAQLVERKKARAEVASVLQEKQLKHEQYIRKLNGLPAFSKMTTEQLRSYAETLRQYDKGDTALSPERIAALNGTDLEGVKTTGEARERAAKITGRPVTDFQNLEVPKSAYRTPDTHLREEQPGLKPFIDYIAEKGEKGRRLAETVKDRNNTLAADAIREMRATLSPVEALADRLAPQQRDVFAYLEAQTPEEVAATAERLGPAAKKWGDFLRAWFHQAYGYLEREGVKTRFENAYAPHVNRGWPEILRDANKVGLGQTIKDLLPTKERELVGHDPNVLGLKKFMRQSLFRSGELTPSMNLVKAANAYMDDFYNKAALDQAVPVVDTLVRSLETPEEKRPGRQAISSLREFTNEYLNSKKGNNRFYGKFGDYAAPAVNFMQTAASIHFIAANYALQMLKAGVGIPLQEYMAIRDPEGGLLSGALGKDLARAEILRHTAEGKAILAKYGFATEKGVWEQLKEPGTDAADYARAAMYGGFHSGHSTAMERLLLGSLTPEELKSGEISDKRIAEIKLAGGRWLDMRGQSSIMGSHEVAGAWKQFKTWAIPSALSMKQDAVAVARMIASNGKQPLTREQVHDVMRLGMTGALAVGAWSILGADEHNGRGESDSLENEILHYARRVSGSVWRTANPGFWMGLAGPGYAAKVVFDLYHLATLEEYKRGPHAGENKGKVELERDLTPKIVKDLRSLL